MAACWRGKGLFGGLVFLTCMFVCMGVFLRGQEPFGALVFLSIAFRLDARECARCDIVWKANGFECLFDLVFLVICH